MKDSATSGRVAGCGRERDHQCGPRPRPIRHGLQAATVVLHDRTGNDQVESAAAPVLRDTGGIDTVEALENPIHLTFPTSKTDAPVTNLYGQNN